MIAKTKNKPLIDGVIILQKRQLLTVSAMLVGNFLRENLQVLVSGATKNKTAKQNFQITSIYQAPSYVQIS